MNRLFIFLNTQQSNRDKIWNICTAINKKYNAFENIFKAPTFQNGDELTPQEVHSIFVEISSRSIFSETLPQVSRSRSCVHAEAAL